MNESIKLWGQINDRFAKHTNMETAIRSKKKIKKRNIAAIIILIGSIGIASVLTWDKLKNGIVFLEGWPDFSTGEIIRSLIIFSSIFMIIWGFVGSRRPKLVLDESHGLSFRYMSIFLVLFLSICFLFLFIYEPSIFNALSTEDGAIEWGSAIFLFGSCGIIIFSFLRSRKVLNIPKLTQLSLVVLSAIFFFMAMEEVSWFQRVLEIETPEAFTGNWQGEMNLHNFATDYIENIYYFGSFIFLVVLPFTRLLIPYLSKNKFFKIFIGRPYIGVIGTIACAYNFDMWNALLTQIAFFGCIIILGAFAFFSVSRKERYFILFTILFITSTQVMFLTNGENFDRIWEVTEYKEFLIPLVLLIYSFDVYNFIIPVIKLDKVNLHVALDK